MHLGMCLLRMIFFPMNNERNGKYTHAGVLKESSSTKLGVSLTASEGMTGDSPTSCSRKPMLADYPDSLVSQSTA